tara:strand:- start:1158 stop:1814 length:657 start_codon:yes stop_codon:yes gene_type:complete
MSTTHLSLLLERVRAAPSNIQLVLAFADAVEAGLLSIEIEDDPENLLEDYLDGTDDEQVWKTSAVGLNPLRLKPKYKNTMFGSMMHLFQANKYKCLRQPLSDDEVQVKMLEMADMELDKVNKLGRTIPIDLAKWEQVKLNVMKGICSMILEENNNLVDALESMPSDVTLYEDSLPDDFWGGHGLNHMGKLWTTVICEFKSNKTTESQATESQAKRAKI